MTNECDSCGRVADILIPIRVLCESKGGYEMQLRHYCPICFKDIVEEWEYPNRGDENEEELLWEKH